jgi:mannose-6-phosphate isomerase-like protein (cupin superfamily)
MRQSLLILFGALLAPLIAQAPAGFSYWSVADLKKVEAGLPAKMNAQKIGAQDLAKWGNHWASITHREGDGEGEVHETVADIFVAQSGGATLIVGGKLIEPREVSKGELKGKGIDGGVRQKLSPGDIVHIPANTPHQLLVPNSFDYFVVKVGAQ